MCVCVNENFLGKILVQLVRYVDISYMIYFGLNKLGNTKQPDIIAAIIDDIVIALCSFGLFYAVNFVS